MIGKMVTGSVLVLLKVFSLPETDNYLFISVYILESGVENAAFP